MPNPPDDADPEKPPEPDELKVEKVVFVELEEPLVPPFTDEVVSKFEIFDEAILEPKVLSALSSSFLLADDRTPVGIFLFAVRGTGLGAALAAHASPKSPATKVYFISSGRIINLIF